MKISTDGEFIYAKKFAGTTTNDKCTDLDLNEDGRVVFLVCSVGSTGYITSTGYAAYILKIDGVNGVLLQARVFDYNRNDAFTAVAVDKYGFVSIAITSNSNNNAWA